MREFQLKHLEESFSALNLAATQDQTNKKLVRNNARTVRCILNYIRRSPSLGPLAKNASRCLSDFSLLRIRKLSSPFQSDINQPNAVPSRVNVLFFSPVYLFLSIYFLVSFVLFFGSSSIDGILESGTVL
jgi:hypothetical protein